MEWKKLLDTNKLSEGRSFSRYHINTFEEDYSKIVSSSAFRRLQDKTQVYPLDDSDFARTRLTHSIEVSTIAYQLGQMLVNDGLLKDMEEDPRKKMEADIPSLLRCAGVLHDLGNPPFGHFGEATIGMWFQENLDKINYKDKSSLRDWLLELNKKECREALDAKYPVAASHEKLGDEAIANLEKFEGNAQALRLLCKAQYAGDINVTYAVISALVKYPTDSLHADKDNPDIKLHKQGVYASEADVFDKKISEAMGTRLGTWGKKDDKNPGAGEYCRHPLTFIMEASDDIAYATSDLEDSYQRGMFTLQQLREHFDKAMPEEAKKIVERHRKLPEEVKTFLEDLPKEKKEKKEKRESFEKLRKQLRELPEEKAEELLENSGLTEKEILAKLRPLDREFDAAFKDFEREHGAAFKDFVKQYGPAYGPDTKDFKKALRNQFKAWGEKPEHEKLVNLLDDKPWQDGKNESVGQHILNGLGESAVTLGELRGDEDDRAFSDWLNGVRAKLMNCVQFTFKNNLEKIKAGTFQNDMFQDSFQELTLAVIKSAMAGFVYDNPRISPTEISGHNSLSFLLDGFVHAALYADKNYCTGKDEKGKPYGPTDKDKKYWKLVSRHFQDDYEQARSGCEPFDLYLRLLTVTDHISAMTDTYAHDLAARLRGC